MLKDTTQKERKGKERKGKEKKEGECVASASPASPAPTAPDHSESDHDIHNPHSGVEERALKSSHMIAQLRCEACDQSCMPSHAHISSS